MKKKSIITVFIWGLVIIVLLVFGPYDGTKLSVGTLFVSLSTAIPLILLIYWERGNIKKLIKILF